MSLIGIGRNLARVFPKRREIGQLARRNGAFEVFDAISRGGIRVPGHANAHIDGGAVWIDKGQALRSGRYVRERATYSLVFFHAARSS
jgi:hypothetical protein